MRFPLAVRNGKQSSGFRISCFDKRYRTLVDNETDQHSWTGATRPSRSLQEVPKAVPRQIKVPSSKSHPWHILATPLLEPFVLTICETLQTSVFYKWLEPHLQFPQYL